MAVGELRGYPTLTSTLSDDSTTGAVAQQPINRSPLPKGKWGGLLPVPHTSLSVTRILYGSAVPVQSITSAATGDVTGDLLNHFAQSDQVASALRLYVQLNPSVESDGTVRASYVGGILAHQIPAAGGHAAPSHTEPSTRLDATRSTSIASRWGDIAARINDPSLDLIASHSSGRLLQQVVKDRILPELAEANTSDSAVFRRVPVDFHCRCSHTRVVAALSRMGPSVLSELEMQSAGGPEASHVVTCQFCNTAYPVTRAQLLDVKANA